MATSLSGLGAILRVTAPDSNSAALPAPPRAADLVLDLPSDSLDQLDFMELSGCAVQTTLIKRNSSLGRQAKPSQRLLLELEYLRLAPACITQLRASHHDALANLLQDAWQLRHTQLPSRIFNATLGSDEYRALWLADPAPGHYPRVSPGATVEALSTINHLTRRWLSGDYTAHNRAFEILLSEVAGGGGATLQGYARILRRIAELEALLGDSLPQHYRDWRDQRNLCCAAPGGDRRQPVDRRGAALPSPLTSVEPGRMDYFRQRSYYSRPNRP